MGTLELHRGICTKTKGNGHQAGVNQCDGRVCNCRPSGVGNIVIMGESEAILAGCLRVDREWETGIGSGMQQNSIWIIIFLGSDQRDNDCNEGLLIRKACFSVWTQDREVCIRRGARKEVQV